MSFQGWSERPPRSAWVTSDHDEREHKECAYCQHLESTPSLNMCCHKDTFVRSFISLTPVSTIFSADEALPVRLQAIGQLLRTGEGDEMAGGHLVGSNAQTFPHDPALKFHGEEAVVAALQEPRRYVGPLP